MADQRFEKAPDAFRTISEVADELALPQHVLRFWETRFGQIKPLKRGGGRRYYRPDDVDLLRGIKHLLYGEGYTIKGVQRILKAQGLRFVQTIWRDPGATPPDLDRHARDLDEDDEAVVEDTVDDDPVPVVVAPLPASLPAPTPAPPHGLFAARPPAPSPKQAPPPIPAPMSVPAEDQAPPAPLVLTRQPEPRPFLSRANPEPAPEPQGLPREDVRRLQSALFELIEAKKLLDAMR